MLQAMQFGPIKRILVPVDFSDCSKRAVLCAGQIASALGARVDLLHVWRPSEELDDLEAWWDTLHPSERSAKSLMSTIEASCQGALNELAVALHRSGVSEVETKLVEGRAPAKGILAAAYGYDLVVMGTEGRTGIAEFFIGSVAERVGRRSPVPVLMVPLESSPRSSTAGSSTAEPRPE
jgi:nucleotide-binding universal stress UspA family protein